MFVLDTDVLSALAPARRQPALSLVQWIRTRADDLYLSAVTIAEIEAGAARLHRIRAGQKARLIEYWIEATIVLFGSRILAFDTSVAKLAGRLHDKARASGIEPGFADVAIAATAHRHGFLLLTRNVKDFAALDISYHDPFVTLPVG
jgi:predicted nucleic acid-binding protein